MPSDEEDFSFQSQPRKTKPELTKSSGVAASGIGIAHALDRLGTPQENVNE